MDDRRWHWEDPAECFELLTMLAMNKLDLTKRLARESHRSRAKAADAVDTVLYKLLKDLKHPTGVEAKIQKSQADHEAGLIREAMLIRDVSKGRQ